MAKVQLRADPLWGEPCLGYSVQARFDDESVWRLRELQGRVAGLTRSAGLNWTPPSTMHVSIFSVIPVRWSNLAKAELWARLSDDVLSVVASFSGPLKLRFQQLECRETALILRTSEQPEPIRSLRERLNLLTVAAGLPKQNFDQTHVTLGRPSRDGILEASLVAEVERLPAILEATVSATFAIRELVYPSLEVETLR